MRSVSFGIKQSCACCLSILLFETGRQIESACVLSCLRRLSRPRLLCLTRSAIELSLKGLDERWSFRASELMVALGMETENGLKGWSTVSVCRLGWDWTT